MIFIFDLVILTIHLIQSKQLNNMATHRPTCVTFVLLNVYATLYSSYNEESSTVYQKLNRAGIIDEQDSDETIAAAGKLCAPDTQLTEIVVVLPLGRSHSIVVLLVSAAAPLSLPAHRCNQ